MRTTPHEQEVKVLQNQQRQQDQQSQSQTPHNLLKLSDTGITLASAAEDIRGRKVVDANGEDVGDVDDLMIHDTEKKVRFLRVASGGFLGMGAQKFLIPVDAIKQIKDDKGGGQPRSGKDRRRFGL